jgi:hypothetical protein
MVVVMVIMSEINIEHRFSQELCLCQTKQKVIFLLRLVGIYKEEPDASAFFDRFHEEWPDVSMA